MTISFTCKRERERGGEGKDEGEGKICTVVDRRSPRKAKERKICTVVVSFYLKRELFAFFLFIFLFFIFFLFLYFDNVIFFYHNNISTSDPMDSPLDKLSQHENRTTRGKKIKILPPRNVAVI